MMNLFKDRREAGRQLAKLLDMYGGRNDVVVLALPRGGVPVGFEVASALGAPLDVFVVRKLGVPWQPELAMGAIASGGVRVLDQNILRSARVTTADIDRVTAEESAELARREAAFRGDRPRVELAGKVVVLVDDGLATGSTMRAAVAALRRERPSRIVVAVPVGAPETCDSMRSVADDVICAMMPARFDAVGYWYEDFSQTSDDEVRGLLIQTPVSASPPNAEQTIAFSAGDVRLEATLSLPAAPSGLVIFAHGSGSSRFSARNRRVAAVIREAPLATLLVDLLSPVEAEIDDVTRQHRFDIPLLVDRVVAAVDWAATTFIANLPIGLFGASTGAAAALGAAVARPNRVHAVVSRGGRPDLASKWLSAVRAPTLLVVGGSDSEVLSLNVQALAKIVAEKRLEVVPGAGHLFEEPGGLDRVAVLARDWFVSHLAASPSAIAS